MADPGQRPMSFISFDVEALPGRASRDPVDRLVWGRVGGGEFGIGRISGILKQHGIKGNFLIDFASCLLYGDRAVGEIADYLLAEGHEVHVHLHSEWMVRKWGLQSRRWSATVGMDQIDGPLSEALLEYAALKYQSLVGLEPALFRAGAFRFNAATLAAAERAGFKVCSNFNSERHAASWSSTDPAAINNEPFRWSDKLVELPVDFAPEPLSHDWGIYEGFFCRVHDRKKIKTFNLTLHSWSLLRLGEKGHFDDYAPAHEERLHQICEHLQACTRPLGYGDFIACGMAIPALSDCRCNLMPGPMDSAAAQCPACRAVYATEAFPGGLCPSCGATGQPWNPGR